MKIRVGRSHVLGSFLVVLAVFGGSISAQTAASPSTKVASQDAMDRDLLEVTVPQLEEMYHRGDCPWMIWDPERSGAIKPPAANVA